MRRVVVTGVGAVTPIGNDVPTFWKNLLAGKNGIVPLDRFDVSEYKAKVAAQVQGFDPLRYMEKGEARKSDLFCHYAMAAACQAVEDSGISGKVEPERFGVYFGSGIGGLITMSAEMQKLLEKGPKRVSPFFIPMMIANMAAGNIAIRFQAKGPCLPVTTACATSTNEVGEAFHAIKEGRADVILAGGAEAAITPIGVAGNIYINAHGTGTPLNDKTETQAIKTALSEKTADILVSSTKSMTGHMLGAAGAVEAIVSTLALHEGVIPPTINLREPDPECDLDYVPNQARKVQAQMALSTSLGFGGHNACIAFKRMEEE